MKSTLIAATALAAITLSAIPAMAQGPFSDVPTYHWAYAAVDRLASAGVIKGYPDKTYGGSRPMTRYEFAAATARLLDVEGIPAPPSDYAHQSDVDAIKAQLGNFATKEDVSDLRRLVEGLRADFDQQEQDIDLLNGKVGALNPTPLSNKSVTVRSGNITDNWRQAQWEWLRYMQGVFVSPFRP